MTMPCEFSKNTGWGRVDNNQFRREFISLQNNTHCLTSTLHRHPKKLKPTEASLFDILPTVILTYI